jgi:hypothetical protein
MSTRVMLNPRPNRRRPPDLRDAAVELDSTDAKRCAAREAIAAAERFLDLLDKHMEGRDGK